MLPPLAGHISTIKRRLAIVAVTVVASFVLTFAYSAELIAWFKRPFADDLIFYGPTEALFAAVKISLLAGIVLSLPVILYQFWKFVEPALLPREQRWAVPLPLYLSNLFEPIQQLSQLYNTLQSAGAALSKIFGLLDTPNSVPEKPGAVDLPTVGVETITRAHAAGLKGVAAEAGVALLITAIGSVNASSSRCVLAVSRGSKPASSCRIGVASTARMLGCVVRAQTGMATDPLKAW